MSDNKVSAQPVTSDDLTVRPKTSAQDSIGAKHPEGGAESPQDAEQSDFVPVGGPRSGGEDEGGTQDSGVNPTDEMTGG